MSDKITKSPQIRFAGFTDAWEQRKAKELCTISTGKGNTQDKVEYGKYPFYVRSATIERSNDFLYDQEAVLTVGDGVGTGKVFHYVNGKYNLHQRVYRMYDFNSTVSTKYFYYYFSKNFYRRVMAMTAKTSVDSVRMEMIADMDITFPNEQEQKKIVDLFDDLDNTITLHQRKLELLKDKKKSLLQKMFPKDGATVPEIRFAGFTDAWEQRKLGDVSERVRGNDGRMDLPTLTISAGSGWLDQRERFSGNIAGKEQKNYTLLSKGELSYNHGNSKLAKYGAVFELKTYQEALVPKVYHSFKTTEEASSDFLEYMFATKTPDRELAKLISSGARMDGLLNINYDEFMSIKITIPKVEEQMKIAKFLRGLDETIALHQRELNSLKNLKKSLFQQMFV
jgi:type I restriction enzyme, S subunit